MIIIVIIIIIIIISIIIIIWDTKYVLYLSLSEDLIYHKCI